VRIQHHSALKAKLRTLALNTFLCYWILDFLTGRPQVVRVGNNTSATLILNLVYKLIFVGVVSFD
jgi:hypothetical protein